MTDIPIAGSPLPPATTDVLICGAGPAGLSTALSVAHHSPSLSITIVDALPTGQNESRALVIHAGTMERLHTINCSEPLAAEGRHTTQVTMSSDKHPLISPDFSLLQPWTRFPYALIIAQSNTEAILAKRLEEKGIKVLRPLRVVSMRELGAGKGIEVAFESGSIITTRYLVGADGSKSTIRTLADISFPDSIAPFSPLLRFFHSEPPTITLADITLQSSVNAPAELIGKFHSSGFFLMVPLNDHSHTLSNPNLSPADVDRVYRVGFYISDQEDKGRARHLNAEFVQGKVNIAFNEAEESIPKVNDIIWTSTFRIRYALANTFFKPYPESNASLLLVGDAAHVHSPVGGQGMNLGIGDGIDAGQAIAQHFTSSPPDDSLLVAFSVKRRSIASQIIRGTKFASWMATITNPIARFARDLAISTLGKMTSFRRGAAWQVSGLRWL